MPGAGSIFKAEPENLPGNATTSLAQVCVRFVCKSVLSLKLISTLATRELWEFLHMDVSYSIYFFVLSMSPSWARSLAEQQSPCHHHQYNSS